MRSTSTVEYCSALSKRDILVHAIIQHGGSLNMGEVKMSQTQTNKHQTMHFDKVPRTGKLREIENKIKVPRGWGKGEQGVIVYKSFSRGR